MGPMAPDPTVARSTMMSPMRNGKTRITKKKTNQIMKSMRATPTMQWPFSLILMGQPQVRGSNGPRSPCGEFLVPPGCTKCEKAEVVPKEEVVDVPCTTSPRAQGPLVPPCNDPPVRVHRTLAYQRCLSKNCSIAVALTKRCLSRNCSIGLTKRCLSKNCSIALTKRCLSRNRSTAGSRAP